MEQTRFMVEFEWQGQNQRATLLAKSFADVGRWLDARYHGVTAVRIERLPAA